MTDEPDQPSDDDERAREFERRAAAIAGAVVDTDRVDGKNLFILYSHIFQSSRRYDDLEPATRQRWATLEGAHMLATIAQVLAEMEEAGNRPEQEDEADRRALARAERHVPIPPLFIPRPRRPQ